MAQGKHLPRFMHFAVQYLNQSALNMPEGFLDQVITTV